MPFTQCHGANRKLCKRKNGMVSVCKLSVIKYHNQKINIRHGRPGPVVPGLIQESAKSCLCVKLLTNMSERRRNVLHQFHLEIQTVL